MSIAAYDVTGKNIAKGMTCAVCGQLDGGRIVYRLQGARNADGSNRLVFVHGDCIHPHSLGAYLATAGDRNAAYYAARDRAEDKRQGLVK